jgi:hypothetical protein
VTHAEISSHLSRLIESPFTYALYSITMQQVLNEIVSPPPYFILISLRHLYSEYPDSNSKRSGTPRIGSTIERSNPMKDTS